MLCPDCKTDTSVVDSRPYEEQGISMIRRRRVCANNHRFTTYECHTKPRLSRRDKRKEYFAERWRNTSPEEKQRKKIRAAARAEARKRGVPPAHVYAEWGVT